MPDARRLPEIDVERTARSLLQLALSKTRHGEVRITVTADQVRWLARKRLQLALGTLPLSLLVGCGALLVSLRLALVAVLGGFFAYAAVSIARRQRVVAREAADFEVTVRGDQLDLPGQAPRPILRAIDRPDYLRLLSTEAPVVAMWLDNRLAPTAFFDLPASPEDRRALCASLRAAGVRVTTESAARRVAVLAGSFAASLLGLVAARSLLKLTAAAVVLWPMAWGVFGAIVLLAWLSGRRRG